ncbi:hypothetical protein [Virgibacillus ainsalahensis]
METTKNLTPKEHEEKRDEHSLKGALFSSIVFVGGGIAFFIVLLFVIYMIRI